MAPPEPAGRTRARLFEPLTLRGLTLRNRIVVSPMAIYSADYGKTGDFHLVHLGRFALGGAGLVFTEAIAVSAEARITHGCAGLWHDDQAANLQRITDFLHQQGAAAGIQLLHSGFKGSSQRPWEGGAALRDDGWPTVSPTPEPFDRNWPNPHALTESEIDAVVHDYQRAAERGARVGFDVIELHCAHGYLLHSFLSPLSNKRQDRYGGTLENRMRLPLRVAEAVRAVWPQDRPMFVRISAVDGIGVGWAIEDSIAFAKALAARGLDAIDCSTGGLRIDRDKQVPARTPGFQAAYAARIRAEAGVRTIAVGLIREARLAEQILREGGADLIALAREMLANPNWPAQAARELSEGGGWGLWPQQFRYWLERRARSVGE